MIVMKFGGTSVGDAECFRKTAKVVVDNLDKRPVVVLSAMTKVTDLLLQTAHLAAEGNEEQIRQNIPALREKHVETIEENIPAGPTRDEVLVQTERLLERLEQTYTGIGLLGETTRRSLDFVGSHGEKMSTTILAGMLQSQGIKARQVNAEPLVVTDANFGAAHPLLDVTYKRVPEVIVPMVEDGIVPVITGFIGGTTGGATTTLGRGGSDYSASLIGRALLCDEIWIWTDVDGVMSADPRIVPSARTLEEISYGEAAELSYFGAKVIHPRTVIPAVERNIPIRIKNTFNPEFPGTIIVDSHRPTREVVKAITAIKNLTLVTVEGAGMIGLPGMASRVFGTVAKREANVLMISQSSSENSICFVIEAQEAREVTRALEAELELELFRKDVAQITTQPDIAIVAVVGAGMKGTRGLAGRLFTAVGTTGANIIAIAQGSSELNVSFVVGANDRDVVIRAIHDEFIG